MTRYAPLRVSVMGLNAAGQNVGIVCGTGLASVGLSLGGYVGLALMLELLSIVAVIVLLIALRQVRAAPEADDPEVESSLSTVRRQPRCRGGC